MNKISNKGNALLAGTEPVDIPQGVIVLGMHRSGTSAFARVLNLLGCALSNNLLGATEGNETGHWEAAEAVSLNDEMLTSAGSSHDDWGPINDDWRNSTIRSQMVHRASLVLADHVKLGPLFAIKDPRMCRLADVWLQAAAEAGVAPLFCLMIRNPAEVAASLETRDLMATGYSELLWLRHVLDAERHTRGQQRVICRYDQLIGNWQGLVARVKEGLGISFPRNSPKAHAEIDAFLTPSQRHHVVDPSAVIASPTYSHWLRTTFQIMVAWSEDGENSSDYPALDEVRDEIDRAYGVFARLLMRQDVTGAAGLGAQLRWELANLRDDAEHKAEALRNASEEAEELRAAASKREAELASHLISSKEAAALSIELAGRTAELADAQSQVSKSESEAATERGLRTETEARLSAASNELHEQHLRNTELTGQVAILQSTLIQRQEELAQLLSQLHEAQSARIRAEIESEQERDLRLEREQRLTSASAEIATLQAMLNDERRSAAQRADALTRDVAELTAFLKEQEDVSHQALEQSRESAAEARRLSEELLGLSDVADEAEAARAAAEQKLALRFNELIELTAIVSQEAARAEASEDKARWLRDVRRLEDGFPRWWAFMPQAWRQRRVHRRYRHAGLFDAQAYLEQYPDVRQEGMDPIRHYILHGIAEGRSRPRPR